MKTNNCEYRDVDQINLGGGTRVKAPIVIGASPDGKYSSAICSLLIPDSPWAPFCKAPQSNTLNCPVAKFFRQEISGETANYELDVMHGENYSGRNQPKVEEPKVEAKPQPKKKRFWLF